MKKSLSIILFIIYITPSLGQKIKTASGDISILTGEKELSVTFGYDNMNVHGYPSESDFIKDKAQIREKNKPGSGKHFKDSWFADRDTVYAPLFMEHFNDALPKKRKISVAKNMPDAKYNLHVQTLWIYTGYNVGIASQPCKIDVVLQLYEKANPKNIVWQSKSPIRIKGKVSHYKRELRIGAAYASLAMSMSWLLKKETK